MDIKKEYPDDVKITSLPPTPYQPKEQQVLYYTPPPVQQESHSKRWTWVRRFIISLAALAFIMHCTSSNRLSQLWKSYSKDGKEHLVLHTGFPAIGDDAMGQSIFPNQGAAIAFSPNTAAAASTMMQPRDITIQKESWWDRWFPWRHVHLKSVQLAVHSPSSKPVKARLAVCTSTRDASTLWETIPDATQCVASMSSLTVLDSNDDPAVLEWIAPTEDSEDAIVLRKKNIYWLVVQTEQDEFDWVYALPSDDYIGDSRVAYETQNGWKLEQGEQVPSVMITVVDH
ncbi:hypothetical protein BDA99DRAFT_507614 [Phascolomyces articulosus]|uniref:Uncharacterized protein n=1 Tax=Phascolomyces articulosus TaxID=60185 RepID=A0AAD5KB85_9FUNG|nr:hypothetical protein BDA99DRAFT_507614 [Phascolomyces articulosus]